jgi:hypothetical protein
MSRIREFYERFSSGKFVPLSHACMRDEDLRGRGTLPFQSEVRRTQQHGQHEPGQGVGVKLLIDISS